MLTSRKKKKDREKNTDIINILQISSEDIENKFIVTRSAVWEGLWLALGLSCASREDKEVELATWLISDIASSKSWI